MSHTLRTAVVVAVGLLLGGVAAVDVRAGEPRRVIRIYDASTGGSVARVAAMRATAALVEDAGIAADWLDCTPGSDDQGCRAIRSPGDLVVRIAPRYITPAHPPGNSVSNRETPTDADLQLGFATIDSTTHIGVLATIFQDRVLTVALRTDLAYSVLLARAIAHEIGHLILPAGGHSVSGLMREVWTDAELTENRPEDWVFARPLR